MTSTTHSTGVLVTVILSAAAIGLSLVVIGGSMILMAQDAYRRGTTLPAACVGHAVAECPAIVRGER